MDIVLIFLVDDGDVAMRGFYGILRKESGFQWREKCDLQVQGVLLIAHGNAWVSILPSSKIGFEFACINNALLMEPH